MSLVVNRSDLISGHFSLKSSDWLRDVYFSLLALARPPSAIRANRGPFCASYSVWEALVKIFCSLLTEASRKNRFFFQIFKKMTEVSQAGPCAEIQEKVNACLAENVSLTNSIFWIRNCIFISAKFHRSFLKNDHHWVPNNPVKSICIILWNFCFYLIFHLKNI